MASATPHSSFDEVMAHPKDFSSATLLAITTGKPANSSISRSFQLSPRAIISSRAIPLRRAHSFRATPLVTPGRRTSRIEKSRCSYSVSAKCEVGRNRQRGKLAHGFSDRLAASCEHHLDRILAVQAIDQRRNLSDIRAVPAKISAAKWVVPLHFFQDYLAFHRTVENHCGVRSKCLGRFNHSPRGLARKQKLLMCFSALAFDQRTVADDQVQVAWQRVGNRARKIESPSGDQHNFDCRARPLPPQPARFSPELARGYRAECRRYPLRLA